MENFIPADGDHITLNERDLRFLGSDETTERRIELPGVTVEDEGAIMRPPPLLPPSAAGSRPGAAGTGSAGPGRSPP